MYYVEMRTGSEGEVRVTSPLSLAAASSGVAA